jgi:hypothetical protein
MLKRLPKGIGETFSQRWLASIQSTWTDSIIPVRSAMATIGSTPAGNYSTKAEAVSATSVICPVMAGMFCKP